MKKLKAMIFSQVNDYNLEEDQVRLIFGLFKETAKSEKLNPAVWLYLNNYSSFETTLEDIIHQAIMYSLEQKELLKQATTTEDIKLYSSYAYKATMKYIYNQYYKIQAKNRKLELMENKLSVGISNNITAPIDLFAKYGLVRRETEEQIEYWNNLVQRVEKNSKTKGGAFKDKTKKQKAINQLKRLDMID